ncbi:MAG: hypothetical protein R6V10_14135 [bacterium]
MAIIQGMANREKPRLYTVSDRSLQLGDNHYLSVRVSKPGVLPDRVP